MTGDTLPTRSLDGLPSRAAARATGAKRYLGKPCHAGHRGERYTVDARCVECAQARKRWEQGKADKPPRKGSAFHCRTVAPAPVVVVAVEERPALAWGLTPRQMRMAAEAALGLRRMTP